ncbi:LANO_0E13454g1_1 [Lachancea nothofagi CBS 11611]|uniref:LANO_0E13454g1_1 n=1 Tax=Lachancea nothofagi CBS 11611 TaxID=1266666 RepID=A0A1G4JZ97_9SACH|nr:LANO_0E13454g1_1 [Lachancea nothofagi CBS 11611]
MVKTRDGVSSGKCSCDKCRPTKKPVRYRFNFLKHMNLRHGNYETITSISYLTEKYGEKRAENIFRFVKCIHKQINSGVNRISDLQASSILPWTRVRLFLLLVTLSQRGGSDYWMEKDGEVRDPPKLKVKEKDVSRVDSEEPKPYGTLIEEVMRQNINENFNESEHDENYVFSSIWANFMEGLINHFLEKVIIPNSEKKVCQQLYKPMMKIISLYNEYNELMEKSERNGFLPANQDPSASINSDVENCVENGKLQTAQRLLWQARQDIPKTISKELTLLSEMYATLSADEQDFELDEFVCSAEEYIELEYLPCLIDVLFDNCGTIYFWKIMIVLEPFFYYIEEVVDEDSASLQEESAKPDPRVVTLEKICQVAAEQDWI